MRLNIGSISNVIGVLLIVVGVLMLTALPFSFYFGSEDYVAILQSSGVAIAVGGLFWWYKYDTKPTITKRDGYVIVTFGWIFMVLAGMLPYLFSGTLETFADAFFESASGMTTTGASVLNDIEATQKGILYWRSLSQWIGGMGIIVLTVALFPLLGIGGVELFVAEAPGPTSDKIHPRIRETAKRLWFIYVGLTALLCVLYVLCGMPFYDALNHALTTMATGGFSTKNASMAHYGALIQYITAFFMFLAGTNYVLIYFGLNRKFKRVWQSDEFKTYLFLTLIVTAIVVFVSHLHTGHPIEQSFREGIFMVISMITTTGFVTGDYTQWSSGVTSLFFLLLFTGACAGSTSGGIKMIRHIVFGRNSILEFKRLLHPNAMIRLKIDKQVVAPRILTHILVFLLIYITLFMWGTLVVTMFDVDLATAASAVATSLGNVGPGLGGVNPMSNFSHLHDGVKIILSILMIIGRLELFSFLIIFSTYFWRVN